MSHETPTAILRHVWRVVNDGNGDMKVLMLQQWIELGPEEAYPDAAYFERGYWQDVPIDTEN